ncbi:serine protease [Bradyrhizobium sp. CCGUVB14]|uniref:S1 family peptidase n=1 Tax=Bradyrhizobium sp. CCGUVB14 TaxID=2949628 RepID=UPI0020B41059|nr:serine protease [Bradyrhizobium sp. CCGUVB14]MCP3442406.1 serine protease [Bradyrhizobium sp. CCGUVB14]
MRATFFLISFLFCNCATARTVEEIFSSSSNAVLSVELLDENGGIVDRGTAFVVSRDGYVVTAAHLMPRKPSQKFVARVGGRPIELYPRDADEKQDVALLQLPPSEPCQDALTISSSRISRDTKLLALGFPGKEGLTPFRLDVATISTAGHGFYGTVGPLRPGTSGGPVLDLDNGRVIGFVQGGTMDQTNSNDIVPIYSAISLLRKLGVDVSIDKAADAGSCVTSRPVSEPARRTTEDVFTTTDVIYYSKQADGDRIVGALSRANIKYSLGPSSKGQENESVAIACTTDVSLDSLKALAKLLLQAGMNLKVINQVQNAQRHRTLEITSWVAPRFGILRSPNLTTAQIEQLSYCPVRFSNAFTQVEDVSNENFIPWYRSDQSVEYGEAADYLCKKEFFSRAASYTTAVQQPGAVHFLNGQTGSCQNCRAFVKLTCEYKQ